MSDFGDRLAEERKRLGLNQTEFGKIGGVTKTSQVNYEAGERSPNVDYWQAVAAIGVDVGYVLTGVRMTTLADQEADLLADFRGCDDEGKSALKQTAAVLAKKPGLQQSHRRQAA